MQARSGALLTEFRPGFLRVADCTSCPGGLQVAFAKDTAGGGCVDDLTVRPAVAVDAQLHGQKVARVRGNRLRIFGGEGLVFLLSVRPSQVKRSQSPLFQLPPRLRSRLRQNRAGSSQRTRKGRGTRQVDVRHEAMCSGAQTKPGSARNLQTGLVGYSAVSP
jgi:hypothetical protein